MKSNGTNIDKAITAGCACMERACGIATHKNSLFYCVGPFSLLLNWSEPSNWAKGILTRLIPHPGHAVGG